MPTLTELVTLAVFVLVTNPCDVLRAGSSAPVLVSIMVLVGSDGMTASADEIAQVADLISDARTALVTTVGTDGRLVSRPLAVLDRPFDGDLWFLTPDPSPKTEEVRVNDQVNVAMQVGDDFLSIAGTASVSRDRDMIDELWNPYAEAWFEGGKDDPSVALLRVHADSAEYWKMNDPKPVALIKYAKAIVTGEQPDVGENRSVDL
jgi:general stress protein 26